MHLFICLYARLYILKLYKTILISFIFQIV
nr:MAG TPA: hypothetical protein [Caudoviricetes sp.]